MKEQTPPDQQKRLVSWARVFSLIDQKNRDKCVELYKTYQQWMDIAPGSKAKHQAWAGGYVDHICETVGIAENLHWTLSKIRPLEFSLSDAVLVLFIHDLEKPFRYAPTDPDDMFVITDKLEKPEDKKKRVRHLIAKMGISLTEEQDTAYQYIEGEGGSYNPTTRMQNPLGAFCHCCDTISARIWFDYPKERKSGPPNSMLSV